MYRICTHLWVLIDSRFKETQPRWKQCLCGCLELMQHWNYLDSKLFGLWVRGGSRWLLQYKYEQTAATTKWSTDEGNVVRLGTATAKDWSRHAPSRPEAGYPIAINLLLNVGPQSIYTKSKSKPSCAYRLFFPDTKPAIHCNHHPALRLSCKHVKTTNSWEQN